MDQTDLEPLLSDLSSQITSLESSLTPLLSAPISTTASTLPLLDKAKLHVLTTYAIESLLFSSLRLSGVDAKAHPVFTELARVRQYFGKIKAVEEHAATGGRPERVLDKGAAGRFIKHGLAGNERYDAERRETLERERGTARVRLEQMDKRGKKDGMEGLGREEEDRSSGVEEEEGRDGTPGSKRKRAIAEEMEGGEGAAGKKARKVKKRSPLEREGEAAVEGQEAEKGETVIPRKAHQAPRGRSEAFQALLKGPIPKAEPQERKRKRHRKSKAEGSG